MRQTITYEIVKSQENMWLKLNEFIKQIKINKITDINLEIWIYKTDFLKIQEKQIWGEHPRSGSTRYFWKS